MVVIEEHYNHDMRESSMSVDVQENHQIVLLPEHFQQEDNNDAEFQSSPNGTSYWVPDVPEDEKPKREAFLKTHKKQPPFAVTDQDGALRNAIAKMFPESHHRLCMWHITQKLPEKVLGDLDADTKFRKDFHKLVWNVYIGPEVFKQRWDDMITR
nr:protein FAR1-related sequence 5-like [Tanacetum cinerariifolium]